jgi:hypothetical protein
LFRHGQAEHKVTLHYGPGLDLTIGEHSFAFAYSVNAEGGSI